jgi:hypothetical protein
MARPAIRRISAIQPQNRRGADNGRVSGERVSRSATIAPPQRSERATTLLFFALLLAGQIALYFPNPGHFFQTDTLLWFSLRLHSFGDFFKSFFERDPAGWYRPLTNRTIQSLLYPIVGLNPTIYHLLLLPVFFLNSVLVYCLTLRLTQRKVAGGIATVFYSVHTVNAYVTYDVAFFTELAYTCFYVLGALSALRYIQSGQRAARWLSVGFYILALLSKEAAVSLPATVAVLGWFGGDSKIGWKARARRTISIAAPHFLVMAFYLVFAIGYLHVGGEALSNVLRAPDPQGPPSYQVTFGTSMVTNLDLALTWAFNLPRGWHTQLRPVDPWMDEFLKAFRFVMIVLAVSLLFTEKRRVVFIGLAWFVIALSPMLALANHFLPYYLYLGLIGFSVVIGTAVEDKFAALARWPKTRLAALLVLFIPLGIICVRCIRSDVASYPLAGGVATPASRVYAQIKQLHPVIGKGALLYFLDSGTSLASIASPWLFRGMYQDPSLETRFETEGGVRPSEEDLRTGRALAFKSDAEFNITDVSAIFPVAGLSFVKDPRHVLSLSTNTVVAGRDSYVITVSNVSNTAVDFFYSFEGRVVGFSAGLDGHGQVRFDVGAETRRGPYHYIGFMLPDRKEAIFAQATITVE